jgi:hypothetical protein
MELNATPDDETYITAVTTVQRAPNRIYSSMSTTEPLPHPFRFPLSVDHLLTLVQYNVYRGLLTNMVLLALPNMFGCDEAEPPISLSMLPLPAVIPPSLAPTSLQLTVPHEPWVDVFPLPALRDNLIRATGTFDSCELCDDSLGTLFDETLTKHDDRNSVCLWGEPWDVNSWEIMEGFAKKWGGLLVGCTELIAATNRWREIRGERPLRISC